MADHIGYVKRNTPPTPPARSTMSEREKNEFDKRAAAFVHTINANVANSKLSDQAFRQFIANSLEIFPQFYWDDYKNHRF